MLEFQWSYFKEDYLSNDIRCKSNVLHRVKWVMGVVSFWGCEVRVKLFQRQWHQWFFLFQESWLQPSLLSCCGKPFSLYQMPQLPEFYLHIIILFDKKLYCKYQLSNLVHNFLIISMHWLYFRSFIYDDDSWFWFVENSIECLVCFRNIDR